MRNALLLILPVLLALTMFPLQLKAEVEISSSSDEKSNVIASEKVNMLTARLNEIHMMDKSALSPPERKELRKEVREIKSELKELGAGGYIITGAAIIIIILLLIVLL